MELYYEVVPDYVMQIKRLFTETIRIWSGFVPVWLKVNENKTQAQTTQILRESTKAA